MTNDEIATDPQAVFERQPIVDLFGDSGCIRILAVLIDGWGLALPVSDIAEQAGVDTQTVYNNIDTLIEYGFVEEADKVGNATRYTIRPNSDATDAFMRFENALVDGE